MEVVCQNCVLQFQNMQDHIIYVSVGFRAACVATASCAVATRAVAQGVRQRPTAGASARVVSPSHSYPTTRIVGFSPSPSQRNGRKRLSPLATIALWPAKIAIAHDCEFGKLRCCSHGRPPPAAGAEGLASLAFDRLRKTA